MSILLDEFMSDLSPVQTHIDDNWWLSRPLGVEGTTFNRVRDAWLVLRGKAVAVHFKSDEKTRKGSYMKGTKDELDLSRYKSPNEDEMKVFLKVSGVETSNALGKIIKELEMKKNAVKENEP